MKEALGVHRHFPWTGTYYQYANRLAVLHFLNRVVNVPSRLLHASFTGDAFPDKRECPHDAPAWQQLIGARDITLGLPDRHALSSRSHVAYVPAFGK